MKNLTFIFLLSLFSACSLTNDNKKNDIDEVRSKNANIEMENFFCDSLSSIQRKCIQTVFKFKNDPKYADVSYSSWDVEGYMTDDELDAISELSIWDLRKKRNVKPVDDTVFFKRFKDVFGYDFDSFSKFLDWEDEVPHKIRGKMYNHNLITILPIDPYRNFYISRKEKVIIDWFNFGVTFDYSRDINTFMLSTRIKHGVQLGSYKNPIHVSSLDYIFHLNNYLFNEANVSRTWLLNNDKYFMAHLLIQYGYDGDNEINKMVLKKNRDNDVEIIDMPVATFHVYPDGKVKILDGLLKSAAELSTAECADYFDWATSIVDRFNASAFYKEEPSDDYDRGNPLEVEYHRYCQKVYNLTLSQRREIVAHVVNYMQPVYEKFIGSGMNYGNPNSDFGDQLIIGCFWNYMMNDHEVIADFEKNNYYGLPKLESLISSMKNFKPFYNEESGEFEPWEYIPMRYRQPDKEEE